MHSPDRPGYSGQPPQNQEGHYKQSSFSDHASISSADFDMIEDLRTARDFAEMIADTVREGLLVLDLDLHVKAANESFYQIFEVAPEETVGRLVFELGSGQWDIPVLHELLEDALPQAPAVNDFEVKHTFEAIGRRVLRLNARRFDEHQLILIAIEDVTERQLRERRLAETRERFDLLVQNAKEYAIFVTDTDTRITAWNPGAERILGWSEDEVLGQPAAIIFTPEDRAAGKDKQELETARATGTAVDERWHMRKDGSRFWGSGFMIALQEGEELRGWAKIVRDNTYQKQAEETLAALNETLEERVKERTRQVHELASTLTMAEQQERRRISQILHDDLQQQLYSIQFKLGMAMNADDVEGMRANIAEAEAWVAQSIKLTRNLTVDLSPPVLKSEGLADMLAWLQAQMQELHELEVEIKAETAFRTPEEDMRVLLFQIVRELLFNVVKHAGTNRATVELRNLDRHVEIIVADEGKGFDVQAAEAQDGKGFGLFSIRERLGLFGGKMRIESVPGDGTRVTLEIPLQLE